MTSREFNQDLARAKREAEQGPVIITDRGEPAYVLQRYVDYKLQVEPRRKMSELLAMPGGEDFGFELPERKDYPRPIDFD